MVKYDAVKDIVKALRKEFKGITAHAYGYSCMSDYDYYHENVNENDFVQAKIYKGGLNNDYHKTYSGEGYFDIGNHVFFMWNLTSFKLDDVIAVMMRVADGYGLIVEKPQDNGTCILLKSPENKGA